MRVVKYDEKTFKLERTRKILEGLGNPQEQVRMVHVAGTVGKGSTVAMIASMLQGCGYAVALLGVTPAGPVGLKPPSALR